MIGVSPEALPSTGLPWSRVSQRWGHPWHSMCSYLGAFPPALARYFIEAFTETGAIVADPFSGRGTTLLEARLAERMPLVSDLNPIAVCLSQAKNADVVEGRVLERIRDLEARYDPILYLPEAQVQARDISLIFHPDTLAQLCYLRTALHDPNESDVDAFLAGALLGLMHGSERQDGSSAYASISMPNTFSMSPAYVQKYVEQNQLQRRRRNVFNLLAEKTSRLCRAPTHFLTSGLVRKADARNVSSVFSEYAGKVDLIVTSPPYLGVVNYARQNWIRSWFLQEDPEEVSADLHDNLTLTFWLEFMESAVAEMEALLSADGVAVMVVGDVAKSSRSVVPLARELIRRLRHDGRFQYVGCLADRLPVEEKTTRIWKETKGKATAIDRVIIISKGTPPQPDKDRAASVLPGMDSGEGCIDLDVAAEYAAEFAGGANSMSA